MKNNSKIISQVLALVLSFVLLAGVISGCAGDTAANISSTTVLGAQTQNSGPDDGATPEFITIEHELGTTDVPFAPARVFCLDLVSLDTMDALGLGEYIAGVQEYRNIPAYLQKYYDDDDIVVLPTALQGKSDETELANAYNAIDGDLIIGGGRQEETYEMLSEYAPTIIMNSDGSYTANHSDDDDGDGETSEILVLGLLELTHSEATKIASIWGLEDEIAEILDNYDARIAAIKAAANGKSGILAAPSTQVNAIVPSASGNALISEISFTNLADGAPEDLGSVAALTAASREKAQAEAKAAAEANGEEAQQSYRVTAVIAETDQIESRATIYAWIAQQTPEYIFITDTATSIEESEASGIDWTGLKDTDVVKNGKVFFLSSVSTTRGGLTYLGNQIAELEAALLG